MILFDEIDDGPLRFQVHAPKGGVTIQGKRFSGGQFIPDEAFEGMPESQVRQVKTKIFEQQYRERNPIEEEPDDEIGEGDVERLNEMMAKHSVPANRETADAIGVILDDPDVLDHLTADIDEYGGLAQYLDYEGDPEDAVMDALSDAITHREYRKPILVAGLERLGTAKMAEWLLDPSGDLEDDIVNDWLEKVDSENLWVMVARELWLDDSEDSGDADDGPDTRATEQRRLFAKAIAEAMLERKAAKYNAAWNEQQHPRDSKGQFVKAYRIQPKGKGINHLSEDSEGDHLGLHVFSSPSEVFGIDTGNPFDYGDEVVVIDTPGTVDNEDVEGEMIRADDLQNSKIIRRMDLNEFAAEFGHEYHGIDRDKFANLMNQLNEDDFSRVSDSRKATWEVVKDLRDIFEPSDFE